MQRSSGPPRWWDWQAIALLFIILQIVAFRLLITEWTPFLYITPTITLMGCIFGVAIGYSRFPRGTVRWLTFLYMLVLLPLQLIKMIDQQALLDEQLASVGGRLLVSLGNFFAHQPVKDPIFFVTIMAITFWWISSWAGFVLVRDQNYFGAIIPSGVGLLVIQNYDNGGVVQPWLIGFFVFTALLLLGRLYQLQNEKSWQARRVFLSPDSRNDLINGMALVAGMIILVSWSAPVSASSLKIAVQQWNQMTQPWREFSSRLNNAFDALKTKGNRNPVDFFGSELQLGTGFSLSDAVMFNVLVPEMPAENTPPRFYWQGRIYDFYQNGQWHATKTTRKKFIPISDTLAALDTGVQPHFRFFFFTKSNPLSLLYAPSQPVWVSRTSSVMFTKTDEGGDDLSAWFASQTLQAGESYQVEAVISNPGVDELKSAGTNYPAWVTDKYLQMPENFSPRVRTLALQITDGAQTPYEQAVLITQYLRKHIEYSDSVKKPPANTDPLEWLLFEYKKGYCVYYATSEVLMLRSLGIPARMAVGFAQGEYATDSNRFVVRKLDAHAWPQVYFPTIGWVEFEPTGNQLELTRPLPRDKNPNASGIPTPSRLENDKKVPDEPNVDEGNIPHNSKTDVPINPSLYLIPLLIAFAALTVYFSRRYAIPARIPIFLRTSIERSGAQAPAWIIHWESWVNLSPIERSFESINFGLRLLKIPGPIHATPAERAQALMKRLPKVRNLVKTLLDEHQTSLYTSREADATQARRAAFNIRTQVLIEKVRTLVEGYPIRSI